MQRPLTPEERAYLETLTLCWQDELLQYARRFLGCRTHLRPDAEDAVQTTLLKAVQEADVLLRHENPAGWLKTSLRYTLLNLRRDQVSHPVIPVAEVHEPAPILFQHPAVDPSAAASPLADVLTLAARVLTESELEIFSNYFLNNYSMRRTAALSRETPAAIRGRIARIRRKLRRCTPDHQG